MRHFLAFTLSLSLLSSPISHARWDDTPDDEPEESMPYFPKMPKGWRTDRNGCLIMRDYSQRLINPWLRPGKIQLSGKIAGTYVEQSIDKEQGDQHEIGVLDLSRPGSSKKRLTHNLIHEAEVEIAPDGKSFLYTERPVLDCFECRSNFRRMSMDGKRDEFVTDGSEIGDSPVGVPAWIYPKGEKFVFISWGTEEPSRLWTYDMKKRQPAAFPMAPDNVADPEVSYDGKLVTFKMPVEGDREFQPSIYVMNSDGSGLRRLTGWKDDPREQYSDHDPVFSLDGKKVYFERYYGPGDWFQASHDRGYYKNNWWGIVEVDIATREEKVIAPPDPCGKHFFWLPTVSPDGKQIMYTHVDVWAEAPKPWTDLWVSDIDGGRPQFVPGSEWFYFFDWTK